ncbi:hypothetical protein [Bacillus sp. ISL-46]|uniref:hypothetical protein n=1 Tax=Bacillus sp. ISL-46 TaxID=2819129 RepID=UPI001BE96924|nr:hypothetical protein [Bacillus sp. ISL-46]MBT2722859.1 hypothetical protein [Bacillus sp. ISL-46]
MNMQRYQKLEEIINTGDYYICTDTGRVWSNKRKGAWLKLSVTPEGYQVVSFSYKGQSHNYKVHELVAYQFLGKALIDLTVNHKNRVKMENGSHNLDLMTMEEQRAHAKATGWLVKGQSNGNSKLDEQKLNKFLYLFSTGNYSPNEPGEMFSVSQSTNSTANKYEIWTHIPRQTAV